MSISSAEQALKQAGRNRDAAIKRHDDAVKKKTNLENEIGTHEDRAERSASESQRASYQRQVKTKQGQLSRARTDVLARLTDSTKAGEKVRDGEAKLRSEEQSEAKRQERAAAQKKRQDEQKERQEEAAERRARQREDAARASAEAQRDARETGQDQKITELERRLEERSREAAPAEVAVLLIGSSPEDQPSLRLDKETREIEKRVRAAEHRDSIYFRPKLARRLTDLNDDLNEVGPTILHFSGHGSEDALAFEDAAGQTQILDNAMLGRLLGAAPAPVRLVVFNSCDSVAQARVAVAHVDIAIGMDTAIDDADAKVFAGQLYSSLAAGASVGTAFAQARFQLEVDGSGRGAEVPQIFAAESVEPDLVVLVNPGAD
jgi:hypothetical protein